jgi:hypothetical protein
MGKFLVSYGDYLKWEPDRPKSMEHYLENFVGLNELPRDRDVGSIIPKLIRDVATLSGAGFRMIPTRRKVYT